MFGLAQFATGRIRRGGHDTLSQGMLTLGISIALRKAPRAKPEEL